MTNEFYPSPTTHFLLPNHASRILPSSSQPAKTFPPVEIDFYRNTSSRPLQRYICKPCSFYPPSSPWLYKKTFYAITFSSFSSSLILHPLPPQRKKGKGNHLLSIIAYEKTLQTLFYYIIFLPTAVDSLILFTSLTIIFLACL